MVEAAFFPDAPLRSFKLTEILNGHTMSNFSLGGLVYGMSPKKWKSLPPDVQKVFDELAFSAGCLAGTTLDNEAAWVVEELKKRGDEFHYLPPEEKARWRDKASSVREKMYIKPMDERGWKGKEIFAKLEAIAEETRKKPCGSESWWGRAGRKE